MTPTINLNRQRRPRIPSISKQEAQALVYNTAKWRRLREWYLREHPLCEDCLELEPEVLMAAVDVHHVIPFQTGLTELDKITLGLDPGNLRSLCQPCHSKKHHNVRP